MSGSSSRFEVPIIPNRPLKFVGEAEAFGEMALRRNLDNAFIENAAFDPERIQYDSDYQNNQALSAAFEAHMNGVLDILKRRYPEGARVVEVGCGKGDFVELMQRDGTFAVSGYDGAYEGDNPCIEKRFLDTSDELDADVVVLRHVLEHIRRPQDFLQLLAGIFGDTDIYIEVPDFDWIASNQAFFDITYEHVNYFTPASLASLFSGVEQQGLLFGDQYQYVIAGLDALDYGAFNAAYDAADRWSPLSFDAVFPDFETMIAAVEKASAGAAVYVWGAATKGVMFCHHLKRLRPAVFERIEAAVDINPMKAGRFMPSVHLSILDADAFSERATGDELVIVMNPNYEAEIVAEIRSRGFHDIRHVSV